MKKYIMAFDQGTSSSRAMIFDQKRNLISHAQKDFTQYYPHEGWVEHDADEIWASQFSVAMEAMNKAKISADEIASIGICNQRETVVVWNRKSGKPISRAIVWQCRRTADYCKQISQGEFSSAIQEKTGLVIDPYFSATKLRWMLDNIPGAQSAADNGELCFGTIDSWLIWKLSGGKLHVTDHSNASRTMLYNIEAQCWDSELLNFFGVPESMLPEIALSSGTVGCSEASLLGESIPISGIAGDQQAALFGQMCFSSGMAKITYGTGGFLLMNTGSVPVKSNNGLLTTVAWNIGNGVEYALEGSIFVAGAAIQWLRDELHLLDCAEDSQYFAKKVEDSGGVYIVPAFTGLGAPHWDAYARGAIFGLSRGTTKSHIIRATLESIAYQSRDVLISMQQDAQTELVELRADGGASANDFLLQFQSDILGLKVSRPAFTEVSALGAALLAGLGVGFWPGKDHLVKTSQDMTQFSPELDDAKRTEMIKGWEKAVSRSSGWL